MWYNLKTIFLEKPMKHIFTRKQAIAIIHQVKNGITDVNIMASVETKNPLHKLSNEQLYSKLCEFMDADEIADVVDEV